MSQNDYVVSDQDGASFLVDINAILQAIATGNSGDTAPATTYAGLIWLDTADTKIKRRNQANDGWVILGDLDAQYMGLLSRSGGAMSGVLQLDKGADIASGATVDLGNATGNSVTITHSSGTTAITSLGGTTALQAGTIMDLTFSISGGTLTLTHNATSLYIPGGNNLPLSDKDKLRVRKTSDSSANWEVIGATKANGAPLALANGSVNQAALATGVAGTGPTLMAYLAANQVIANSTVTRLLSFTELKDSTGTFASGRWTPDVPGTYLIVSQALWNAPGARSQAFTYIYKNSSPVGQARSALETLTTTSQLVVAEVEVNGTTDFIDFYVFQASGANLAVVGGSQQDTYIHGTLVRAA